MAHDYQAKIQSLRTPSDDLTPTPATHTSDSHNNDKCATITHLEREHSEETGRKGNIGSRQLTSRASDTDLSWLAHAEDTAHAATPPIDVPRPANAREDKWSLDRYQLQGGNTLYEDFSPLDQFMKNRRPSISFSPQVILDPGNRRGLEEPLPKLAVDTKPKGLALETKSGGHTLGQDLAPQAVRSPLFRTHSEADLNQYDTTTGELILSPRPIHNHLNRGDHSQYSLLQPANHNIAGKGDPPSGDQAASLTSDSTASPVISEVRTPPENMDILLSPISTFPPFAAPHSLEDSSAWPMPRRQQSGSRAKSYTTERKMSMRQVQRRQSSRRSTSSSMSPATAFLSRFAKEELSPEPDSEGQEVGEYVLGKQVGFGGFSTVKEAYTLEGDERICRAAKIVRKLVPGKEETENEQLQAEFEHEVSLWRCLGHRNILPLIEVYDTQFATFCFTKLNTGGTLFDLIRSNRQGLSRDLARRYAYQLASAIRYLHEDVRVVHRDIKLENCLVDISDPESAKDGGNLLLCDFGLAEFITNDTRSNSPDPYERAADRPPPRNIGPSESSTSIAGSLQYASPELIQSPAGFLSPVVDVWAYGVVVFALLVGDLPFQHVFQPRVQMMILAGEWDTHALETAKSVVGYEDEVLELAHGCLEMESERRWTIAKVLGCRWLQGCQEMLEEVGGGWKL